MKSMILEPTDENILSTLVDDKFQRLRETLYFVLLLDSIQSNYSIALDGKWGSGKTFFVMHVKLIMNACNKFAELDDTTRQRVRILLDSVKFKKKETLIPQITIYYDAWSNDNSIDPLLSILYCIEQSTKEVFYGNYSADKGKLLSAVFEVLTGRNVDKFFESIKDEASFEELETEIQLRKCVDEYITKILADKNQRMIVFIDELDRCKPSYAVLLLERIKHYFKDKNITFVFSTNLEQLQHTIKRYYGENIDASGYLERFFDISLQLPAVDKNIYCSLLNFDESNILDFLCKVIIKKFNFEYRETVKFYTMVNMACGTKVNAQGNYIYTSTGRAFDFCLTYVAPVLIALKLKDESKYRDFIDGNNGEPLYDILDNNGLFQMMFNDLLNNNETFDPQNNSKGNVFVSVHSKLELVYNTIFKDLSEDKIDIGKMTFTIGTKNELMKSISALSGIANYNM